METFCVSLNYMSLSLHKSTARCTTMICGKFVSPATVNVRKSSSKVPDAALKQKNSHLLMNFIRRVVWLNRSPCKYPLFLPYFNENLNFSTDFRKILKHKISLKSVQWEPTCFLRTESRTDGQTDRQKDTTKPKVAFRNFANPPPTVNSDNFPKLNYLICLCIEDAECIVTDRKYTFQLVLLFKRWGLQSLT
jgi:hypothetical protein